MSRWATALLLFASLTAHSDVVKIEVSPAKPLVIDAPMKDANGDVVRAPWIQVSFNIFNWSSEQILFNAMVFNITTTDGRTLTLVRNTGQMYALPPGDGMEFAQLLVGDLPKTTDHILNVQVDFMGSVGPTYTPSGEVVATTHFQTQ